MRVFYCCPAFFFYSAIFLRVRAKTIESVAVRSNRRAASFTLALFLQVLGFSALRLHSKATAMPCNVKHHKRYLLELEIHSDF